MSKKFTHLHVHSHYSLLDGLSKIPDLISYTKELGMDAIALTDHGALYGAVEFYKEAKKAGIKPIIGCEVYMAYEDMHQKRPRIDNKRYHLVLLVKNKKGYENLVKLVTKAHLEGYYYKPRIDRKLLAKHSDGLIATSACVQGEIPRFIIADRFQQAEKRALEYLEMFGQENFYLELQHHPNIKEQERANQGLLKISRKYSIPIIATNDSHYLRPEDAKAQDILMLVNTGANKDDPERLTMIADDFSLRSPEEMADNFKDYPEVIRNTEKIKEKCNFEFDLGKTILPKFNPPDQLDSKEYLENLCYKGIKNRYGDNPPEGWEERLKTELATINEMGFIDYFLIVQDFVSWAKKNEIVVGPARGSAGGCFISYLLGITEIDPFKYGLLFERFLNKGRVSMPDIDLDFADHRRDEVIEYVRNKYGKDKVAQIITFGTMAARGAIRDVGRALGYSYRFCDQVAKMIPFGFSLENALSKVPELRNLYKKDERAKELIDEAKKLEGVARHVSTHACGIIISHQPLNEIVPLQHPTQDEDAIVTQYEMHSVEDIGLLKVDFLGLRNLTIIENALRFIEKNHGEKIDLAKIPLDDKKTFSLFQKANTSCVFQLESSGMKKYLRQMKPTELEDIIVILALYRPGPIEFIPKYIRRKQGKEEIVYLHPDLEPILKNTYGIMVFQEQLMEMARKLAGFTLPEADTLRKAVGKKIRSLLEKQEKKLIQGMTKNGIKEEVAKKIWKWVLPFARYGFNKSHSTAYAIIAYQTAYLKANYPVEFMAAVFASEKADVERTAFLIEECKAMGIDVLPPDINESEENFTVVNENKIRFGLSRIKNVGEGVVSNIVNERKKQGPFSSIADFVSRANPRILNKKPMESLIKAGAFDNLAERNQLLQNLETLLFLGRTQQKHRASGQKSLFSNPGKGLKRGPEIKLEKVPPADKQEKLKWEKELLGVYVSAHPLEKFKDFIKSKAFPIADVSYYVKRRVRIGGIISQTKKILTKNGDPMLFATIEDWTDKIEVVVFPRIFQENLGEFEENSIVLVSGKVDNKDGRTKIICESVQKVLDSTS